MSAMGISKPSPTFSAVLRKKSIHREFNSHKFACDTQLPLPAHWWHAPSSMRTAHSLLRLVSILLDLAQGALQFLLLGTRSSAALKAENIVLRKQLALCLEGETKPRRATDATRLSMVLLSRLFAWQSTLINVKPETFLGWHRKGFQLLWRWKSRPRGRPRLREEVQKLIQRMARENPT